MKRWALILAVVCAAAAFPIVGCSDDDVTDDGGHDTPREDTGGDADADGDADAADADADADDAGDVEAEADPCGAATCPNDPTDGPIGEACLEDTDCESGFRCMTESVEVYDGNSYISWLGGYCFTGGYGMAGCDPDITDTCPDGSGCVSFGESETTGETFYGCVDRCSAASSTGNPWTNNCDCRDGYECSLGGEFCFPGCNPANRSPDGRTECCQIYHDGVGGARDYARQAGEITQLPESECTDTCDPCKYACIKHGCPGGACRIGDPCVHDANCPANGRCLDEYSYGEGDPGVPVFPGGICIQDRCDLNTLECPLGAGCMNLGSSTDPFYACVVPCNSGSEPGDAGYPCRDVGETGVGDAGDYACQPVFSADYWYDSTTEDGFCWPGNFTDGTGALGSSCTVDADCDSPHGLGSCISLSDTPPLFCTAWCNQTSGVAGVCGTAAAGEVAPGACFSGLCLESCDTPNGTLGANGCTLPNMACYATTLFGTGVSVATGTTVPAGVCFTPCVNDTWCSDMWGTAGTCNVTTGVCNLGK